MVVLIKNEPMSYCQCRHSQVLQRWVCLGQQPAICTAPTAYVTCWVSTFGLGDKGECVRQETDLDGAVSPSCLNSLLNICSQGFFSLWKQHKVNWIELAYMQQQQKKESQVKWIGEKTSEWANTMRASKSAFSMSTGYRVKYRQMHNCNRR